MIIKKIVSIPNTNFGGLNLDALDAVYKSLKGSRVPESGTVVESFPLSSPPSSGAWNFFDRTARNFHSENIDAACVGSKTLKSAFSDTVKSISAALGRSLNESERGWIKAQIAYSAIQASRADLVVVWLKDAVIPTSLAGIYLRLLRLHAVLESENLMITLNGKTFLDELKELETDCASRGYLREKVNRLKNCVRAKTELDLGECTRSELKIVTELKDVIAKRKSGVCVDEMDYAEYRPISEPFLMLRVRTPEELSELLRDSEPEKNGSSEAQTGGSTLGGGSAADSGTSGGGSSSEAPTEGSGGTHLSRQSTAVSTPTTPLIPVSPPPVPGPVKEQPRQSTVAATKGAQTAPKVAPKPAPLSMPKPKRSEDDDAKAFKEAAAKAKEAAAKAKEELALANIRLEIQKDPVAAWKTVRASTQFAKALKVALESEVSDALLRMMNSTVPKANPLHSFSETQWQDFVSVTTLDAFSTQDVIHLYNVAIHYAVHPNGLDIPWKVLSVFRQCKLPKQFIDGLHAFVGEPSSKAYNALKLFTAQVNALGEDACKWHELPNWQGVKSAILSQAASYPAHVGWKILAAKASYFSGEFSAAREQFAGICEGVFPGHLKIQLSGFVEAARDCRWPLTKMTFDGFIGVISDLKDPASVFNLTDDAHPQKAAYAEAVASMKSARSDKAALAIRDAFVNAWFFTQKPPITKDELVVVRYALCWELVGTKPNIALKILDHDVQGSAASMMLVPQELREMLPGARVSETPRCYSYGQALLAFACASVGNPTEVMRCVYNADGQRHYSYHTEELLLWVNGGREAGQTLAKPENPLLLMAESRRARLRLHSQIMAPGLEAARAKVQNYTWERNGSEDGSVLHLDVLLAIRDAIYRLVADRLETGRDLSDLMQPIFMLMDDLQKSSVHWPFTQLFAELPRRDMLVSKLVDGLSAQKAAFDSLGDAIPDHSLVLTYIVSLAICQMSAVVLNGHLETVKSLMARMASNRGSVWVAMRQIVEDLGLDGSRKVSGAGSDMGVDITFKGNLYDRLTTTIAHPNPFLTLPDLEKRLDGISGGHELLHEHTIHCLYATAVMGILESSIVSPPLLAKMMSILENVLPETLYKELEAFSDSQERYCLAPDLTGARDNIPAVKLNQLFVATADACSPENLHKNAVWAEGAATQISTLAAEYPEFLGARLVRGKAAFWQGAFTAALEDFEFIVSKSPAQVRLMLSGYIKLAQACSFPPAGMLGRFSMFPALHALDASWTSYDGLETDSDHRHFASFQALLGSISSSEKPLELVVREAVSWIGTCLDDAVCPLLPEYVSAVLARIGHHLAECRPTLVRPFFERFLTRYFSASGGSQFIAVDQLSDRHYLILAYAEWMDSGNPDAGMAEIAEAERLRPFSDQVMAVRQWQKLDSGRRGAFPLSRDYLECESRLKSGTFLSAERMATPGPEARTKRLMAFNADYNAKPLKQFSRKDVELLTQDLAAAMSVKIVTEDRFESLIQIFFRLQVLHQVLGMAFKLDLFVQKMISRPTFMQILDKRFSREGGGMPAFKEGDSLENNLWRSLRLLLAFAALKRRGDFEADSATLDRIVSDHSTMREFHPLEVDFLNELVAYLRAPDDVAADEVVVSIKSSSAPRANQDPAHAYQVLKGLIDKGVSVDEGRLRETEAELVRILETTWRFDTEILSMESVNIKKALEALGSKKKCTVNELTGLYNAVFILGTNPKYIRDAESLLSHLAAYLPEKLFLQAKTYLANEKLYAATLTALINRCEGLSPDACVISEHDDWPALCGDIYSAATAHSTHFGLQILAAKAAYYGRDFVTACARFSALANDDACPKQLRLSLREYVRMSDVERLPGRPVKISDFLGGSDDKLDWDELEDTLHPDHEAWVALKRALHIPGRTEDEIQVDVRAFMGPRVDNGSIKTEDVSLLAAAIKWELAEHYPHLALRLLSTIGKGEIPLGQDDSEEVLLELADYPVSDLLLRAHILSRLDRYSEATEAIAAAAKKKRYCREVIAAGAWTLLEPGKAPLPLPMAPLMATRVAREALVVFFTRDMVTSDIPERAIRALLDYFDSVDNMEILTPDLLSNLLKNVASQLAEMLRTDTGHFEETLRAYLIVRNLLESHKINPGILALLHGMLSGDTTFSGELDRYLSVDSVSNATTGDIEQRIPHVLKLMLSLAIQKTMNKDIRDRQETIRQIDESFEGETICHRPAWNSYCRLIKYVKPRTSERAVASRPPAGDGPE